jgi:hypothetical protein
VSIRDGDSGCSSLGHIPEKAAHSGREVVLFSRAGPALIEMLESALNYTIVAKVAPQQF